MSSIKLSPKHGVNPTLPVCFFCGEDKGEIALLGKIGGRGEDIEAPKRMLMDYEPCDKCKENMAKGITMIGVVATEMEDKRPPIVHSGDTPLYPTGAWVVVTEDFIRRTLDSEELAENIIKARKTVADDAIVRELCRQIEELNRQEEE